MKTLGVLAVASMALMPAFAGAASTAGADEQTTADKSEYGRPISGPLAGRVLKHSEIPVGAIIVGSLVLLGGVVIGILAKGGGSDSNNNTNGVSVPVN